MGFHLSSVFVLLCIFLNVLCKECIYDSDGKCIDPCPPDTYTYAPGCARVSSLRTCQQPVARRSLFISCDFSRCECRLPKVWDDTARKCVLLKECSELSEDTGTKA